MSASLVGYLTIFGIIGVSKSVRTPSKLMVEPAMTSHAPVLGVTAGFSCRDNMYSLLKS